MTCDILSLPTQAQNQQDEVPQRSVQPEGGCELIPGDAQLGELYIVITYCTVVNYSSCFLNCSSSRSFTADMQ